MDVPAGLIIAKLSAYKFFTHSPSSDSHEDLPKDKTLDKPLLLMVLH